MAQDTVTKCLGLVTQYNPLTVSSGALIVADDCTIKRENCIENRRGYDTYGSIGSTASQMMNYLSRSLVQYSTKVAYDNGSGTFSDYSGSYSPPTGRKMRFLEARSNLYVTTDSGVKVFSDVAGTVARSSGVPRSLEPNLSLNAAGTGFLSTAKQVAYRALIYRTDANANVIFGYPSSRVVISNASGVSKNIDITIYLVSEVTTGDLIQVYRTAQVTGSSTSDNSGDEMALIYQAKPSSTDISNGFITFTDSVDDSLRGTALYTNPSQEGILQGNDRPPVSKDLELYKNNFLFYANTSTKQRMNMTLVGTSGLTGKTLTLAGVTYNFGATEIISGGGSPQAKVSATGTAAVDIDLTARSLVNVINRYASNTAIYAYYNTDPTSLPGQISLEERGIGAAAFTANGSDTTIAGMFSPALPVNPATNTTYTSSNSVQKNYLYYSKTQQPEHVPALNNIPVGPATSEILRIVALRDSLVIIKQDGVYRLTGETPSSFSVVPLDLTTICKAADSVVRLSNNVFMLSNQGVVAINDTGVQVVSREIEPSILPLASFSNTSTNTYGIAYESERSYYLSTVATSVDTGATQTFVYNFFTKTWVRHTYPISCGIVEPTNDILYFVKPLGTTIYKERKSFSGADYADPGLAITITAISGSNVTFTLSSGSPSAGDAISQGTLNLLIQSVTGSGPFVATLLYSPPVSLVTGAATLTPGIKMRVVWDAWSAEQPGVLKQSRQAEILTDNIAGNTDLSSLIATFYTDIDGNTDEETITSPAYKWGSSPWGQFPWGGQNDTFAYRTLVPRNKQYFRIMNAGVKHMNALEKISINGISYTYEFISERTSK